MLNFFLSRLREPSTWRGLILLSTALGLSIKPELAEAIIALGMALAGGVAVVTPDAPKPAPVPVIEEAPRASRPFRPDPPPPPPTWRPGEAAQAARPDPVPDRRPAAPERVPQPGPVPAQRRPDPKKPNPFPDLLDRQP